MRDNGDVTWPRSLALAMIAATLGATVPRAEAPSSANFTLEPSSSASAGETATSAGFRLTGSLAQAAPTTASASASFVLQSGFWSFLGSLEIPIVLAVERNASDAEHCDLSWSGNAPPYEVYAAADCANILDYPFTTVSDNDVVDLDPPVARLVCFEVLSIAAPRLAVRREEHEP